MRALAHRLKAGHHERRIVEAVDGRHRRPPGLLRKPPTVVRQDNGHGHGKHACDYRHCGEPVVVVQSLCDSVARLSGKEESNNDMASNKRRRHTPDQIIRRLAEGNKLLGAGQELGEVCRHLEIAESTWHRWLAQYGGMKANEAKRLKELEAENARLKKLVANQALDIDMLKEISAGNF